jgi:NitT/TauT family transport system ATP-binding protein
MAAAPLRSGDGRADQGFDGGRTSAGDVSRDAPKVRVSGVDKFFLGREGAVRALAGVDLEVADGEFLCLVGPSGCGKSTLLRIIGGLEQPTHGTVDVAVAEGTGSSDVAFVFQEYGLFPWLNVLDNAAFGLRMAGVARGERREKARYWLDRVGLGGFETAYPDQLSGGMKQRLSIARAFVTDPEVLLMDEPMAALDAQTRALLQEDLISLWEAHRKTLVLVTHSIDEAVLLSDRIIVMTRRPGLIKTEFQVNLPRPRTQAIASSPEFGDLRTKIWDTLRDEVEASLELT